MKRIENIVYQGASKKQSVLSLYMPENSDDLPILIFIHGFKGFKDWGTFPVVCEKLAKKGYVVLAFNFSHNGGTVNQPIDFPDLESFGDNTYSKELEDIGNILEWIKRNEVFSFSKTNQSNIYLLGHSRGGGMALVATSRFKEIKKVVTWAAVADFEKRLPETGVLQEWKKNGIHYIKNGRTKQLMPMKYSFVEDLYKNREKLSIQKAVKEILVPQLVIHGTQDETVPIADAQQLQKWNPNAELVLIEKANHTFNGKHPWKEEELPIQSEEAIERTVRFLKH